jgi:hypothetical protein
MNTRQRSTDDIADSNFARHAFDTFIPISVESEARKRIIFDFFDLLSAVAARGKTNGMGGRKLSRLAGWWAFEFLEDGKGFDGGYRTWEKCAYTLLPLIRTNFNQGRRCDQPPLLRLPTLSRTRVERRRRHLSPSAIVTVSPVADRISTPDAYPHADAHHKGCHDCRFRVTHTFLAVAPRETL